MADDLLSTIRRSMSTRRSRTKNRSISSLSAVSSNDSASDMRISPPISPPVTPPREDDMLLAGGSLTPRRAPAPPSGAASWSKSMRASFASSTRGGRSSNSESATPPEVRHTPPTPPPGAVGLLASPAHIGRSSTVNGYTSASMRHPTPPALSSSAAAPWRTHLLSMARSYSSITSAEADFDPASTQRAHFQAVVNRLADPVTTELEGLAVLRAYIDHVHSSTRNRARVARRFIPE